MGRTPTPTRTLGMHLSCNFANVYTTAYRVQYTRTCVHARIPITDNLARILVSDKSARILVRVSVSVSVSVAWNSSLMQLLHWSPIMCDWTHLECGFMCNYCCMQLGLLHATRCNNCRHSNMLECLQLLQRVACNNCTQQLHMKPRHNSSW